MTIFKQFYFDAAHLLPNVPQGHKCKNLHGHTYKLIIEISGSMDEASGWVIDFDVVSKVYKDKIGSILDHKYLNEIPGLENPTVENIILWIWKNLKNELIGIKKLTLFETPSCGAYYMGENE